MTHTLRQLGYGEFFEQQMKKLGRHFHPARVVGQHRRQWDVLDEEGVKRAVLAGRLWADARVTQLDDAQPAVGDWVALEPGTPHAAPVIAHVLDRKTSLARTSMARRGLRQTLVANIDVVAIVAAFAASEATDHVAKRSMHPRRIERYVSAVRQGGAEPLVLLNKADLSPDPHSTVERLEARLDSTPVLAVSCAVDEGLTVLLERLAPSSTIGLVGLSGVGKSSIVNRILGRAAQQIGAERQGDARGRHTTTHRELFVADSGFLVIDTPGMREFALSETEGVDSSAFDDIVQLARQCQFRDCGHDGEPGCRVQQAVDDGSMDRDRLANFQALLKERQTNRSPQQRKPLTRRRQKYPSRRAKDYLDDD